MLPAPGARATLPAMNTALIVIDAQQSFTRRPYFDASELQVYLEQQNRLIAACAAAGLPVVRVLHGVDKGPENVASDPFAAASGLLRPLDGLAEFDPAAEFLKNRHSALVGTGLDVWLQQRGLRRLLICGIRTEQCCETTARHASDLGWQVGFVDEATLTFPMRHLDHTLLSTADIHRRTCAVLQGRFAQVLRVDEAVAWGAAA
jgi:nicotinamidase-related amidase